MMIEQLIRDISPEALRDYFRNKIAAFKPVAEDLSYILTSKGYTEFSELQKIGEIEYGNSDELVVFSCKYNGELTSRNSKKKQYEIAKLVIKEEFKDAAIFSFIDETGNFRFSLVRAGYTEGKRDWSSWKRYTYFVTQDKPNKTFRTQIGKCNFGDLEEILKAFSIEAVTDEFYNSFSPKFDEIANSVRGNAEFQIKQDFALLFVIRTIFIGFVQKRKWLGDDEEFLQSFWQEYSGQFHGNNQFYTQWLEPLFFEALSSEPGTPLENQNNQFSKNTRATLLTAPYLNGELFKRKTGFDDQELFIPDKMIGDFFEFLFQYNFTVEENTRYDEDLELNPEFLGIIFERLVNKKDGAVYTPRTEVDFMCRISLVKWLQKVSSCNTRDLYYLFFREKGDGAEFDDYQKEGDFSRKELEELIPLLKNVTVCDPASGSGAFPVGMMQVLNETLENLQSREKTPEHLKKEDDFDRKKAIIANSLYGVEVKRWAVWINQLRLWLSLFVDIPQERELEFRHSFLPLLPNLGFKIRRGDSLVQRIGGKLFPIQGHQSTLSSTLKKQIAELKKAKIDFFYNRSGRYNEIRKQENSIFRTIINEQISEKVKELRILKREPEAEQTSLFGQAKPKQTNLELYKTQIEQIERDIQVLREEKEAFMEDHPLIWSIEFSEIFFERDGFDIIIGNPPYVRQEEISDPEGKIASPVEYKRLLQETIRAEFPRYFKPGERIDGKSDLYTYFYLKSLRLLNEQGVHTFICSNSWLDVGYGAWLQKFLLNHCQVNYIIDNHARRSFASADINTIISVIDAPVRDRRKLNQAFEYKFVAYKKPFDDVLFTENLLEIEEHNGDIIKKLAFRSYPIKIAKLIEEGSEFKTEQEKKLGSGEYIGDKWGARYLRVPEIFLRLMEKSKGRLVKLKDVGLVRFGLKTGCNSFFILNESKLSLWKIEDLYLRPFILSPREFDDIIVKKDSINNKLFFCNKPKSELIGTNALKYIEWGEQEGFHEGSSVRSRLRWYEIPAREVANFHFNYMIHHVGQFYLTESLVSNNFHDVYLKKEYFATLNSILSGFFQNVLGRSNLGGGVLKIETYELAELPIVDVKSDLIPNTFKKSSIFEECGIDPTSDIPISEQEPNPLPDRKELDDVVFDALELTEGERKEVYRAVCQLVWNRISKARSV